MLIAAGSAALAQRIPSTPQRRSLFAAVAGALLIIPAIAMVGFQRGYQDRARRDADELAQLRHLIPAPPVGAVFAPVWIARPEAPSRHAAHYDHYYWSAFASWWAACHALRFAYQRNDLNSGDTFWSQCGVLGLRPHAVVVRDVGEVPLHLVIPFTIDPDSRISLVTELRSGVLSLPVPLTTRIARDGGLPDHVEEVP
jgi:hypothetical protein